MSSMSETATSRGVWRVSSWASSSRLVNLLLFVLSVTVVMTIATDEPSLIQPHELQKRNAVQLCFLLNRYTGRNCLDYNRYGCYCGLGNRNHAPLDAIDRCANWPPSYISPNRCCQAHDFCYRRGKSVCFLPLPLVTYKLNCGSGASCRCPGRPQNSVCQVNTCQCDLKFVQCLRGTRYNQRLKGFCPR